MASIPCAATSAGFPQAAQEEVPVTRGRITDRDDVVPGLTKEAIQSATAVEDKLARLRQLGLFRQPSTPAAVRVVRAAGQPAAFRPLFPDLVLSEWTKLWTVWSTSWTLVLTVLALVGPGAVFTAR